MTKPSPSSLAALLLVQRLVDAPVPPLKAREHWALLDRVGDPAALLGMDAEAIATRWGVDAELAERVARLLDAATAFGLALEDAEQTGLRVVSAVDDAFPAALRRRLGDAAPPILYAVGDLTLLDGPLLGIVGSRNVDPDGADAAKAAAEQAAAHGMGVVSGGARGVDQLAMGAALDADGAAVGVLADSLLRATRDPHTRRLVNTGRLCLCTAYKPSAGFSVASAMGRNKVIYALSRASLVVAADHDKGGTWAGAVEALRHAYAPVMVWTGPGAGPGNAALVERGGVPVASADELFPLPEPASGGDGEVEGDGAGGADQLPLDL